MQQSNVAYRAATLMLVCVALTGCLGIPDNATAVRDFDAARYLGKWYEIARLDHRFERGLSNVTAHYSMRDDGGIDVVNRGYNVATGQWQEAKGKAYFIESPDVGRLKVTFFWPFYGAYNIIDLDQDAYDLALVVGPDYKYLWILARTPQITAAQRARLVGKARALGFPTDDLIFVDHDAGLRP